MSADGLSPFHGHKQSAYRGQRWLCSIVSCFLLCLPSESVTEVRTNIYVTSFGPVSDTDMVSMFSPTSARVLIATVSHWNSATATKMFPVEWRFSEGLRRGFTCKSDRRLETTDKNIFRLSGSSLGEEIPLFKQQMLVMLCALSRDVMQPLTYSIMRL